MTMSKEDVVALLNAKNIRIAEPFQESQIVIWGTADFLEIYQGSDGWEYNVRGTATSPGWKEFRHIHTVEDLSQLLDLHHVREE